MPIFFISAYREEQVVAKVLDKGAVDYVVSPFSQAGMLLLTAQSYNFYPGGAAAFSKFSCDRAARALQALPRR